MSIYFSQFTRVLRIENHFWIVRLPSTSFLLHRYSFNRRNACCCFLKYNLRWSTRGFTFFRYRSRVSAYVVKIGIRAFILGFKLGCFTTFVELFGFVVFVLKHFVHVIGILNVLTSVCLNLLLNFFHLFLTLFFFKTKLFKSIFLLLAPDF